MLQRNVSVFLTVCCSMYCVWKTKERILCVHTALIHHELRWENVVTQDCCVLPCVAVRCSVFTVLFCMCMRSVRTYAGLFQGIAGLFWHHAGPFGGIVGLFWHHIGPFWGYYRALLTSHMALLGYCRALLYVWVECSVE